MIKNRIRSVKNTKKITKAMEMVSAAKMRRAVENALNTRSYAELSLELLVNISRDGQVSHSLLQLRPTKNILAIVIASNKGLCGSYNANIAKACAHFGHEQKKAGEEIKVHYITIGKKAEQIIKRMGGQVIASFINFSDNVRASEISGLTKIAIDEFSDKKYDRVMIIYTNFLSSLRYLAETRPLLPINEENIKYMIETLGRGGVTEKEMRIKRMSLYLFEPNQETILNQVLPRLTEIQIYQALLESAASEYSARMMAMRNASEAASEMIDELTLNFNQARQSGITREIAEISAGAAVLG